MCIIAFRWTPEATDGYKLILAANRDEFLNRPSANACRWEEPHSAIIAGRDLDPTRPANGTWLGVREDGHVACLTNVRELPAAPEPPRGRGELATGYLTAPCNTYGARVVSHGGEYNGFNLLTFDLRNAVVSYTTNRGGLPASLETVSTSTSVASGTHILTNGELDAPWHKAEQLREAFTKALQPASTKDASEGEFDSLTERLVEALSSSERCPDTSLHPPTGLPASVEDALSSVFIPPVDLLGVGQYGTRAQTVVLVTTNNTVYFFERAWQPGGEWVTNTFHFQFDADSSVQAC
eukprot:m.39401 g.39401  ORF g.39401 m.39401 type:complete len:295 (+) comp12673_c0_seq2:270-1154(+)